MAPIQEPPLWRKQGQVPENSHFYGFHPKTICKKLLALGYAAFSLK